MSDFLLPPIPIGERRKEYAHDSYVAPILMTMYQEQSEHLYSKFSEAYLKYRKIVIEWIIDVTDYFNLHITTTHAAIAYLDRLQPNEKFTRNEWQMLAICCILISSKYNECEEYVPPLRKIEDITQQKISNESILNYELWVLKKMGWKLNARTPVAFLTCFFELGIFLPEDRYMNDHQDMDREEIQMKLEDLMIEIASHTIVDVHFKNIQASALASAIVYFVRKVSNVYPVWSDELTVKTLHNPLTDRMASKALGMLMLLKEFNPNPIDFVVVEKISDEFENKLVLQEIESSLKKSGSYNDISTPTKGKENEISIVSPTSTASSALIA